MKEFKKVNKTFDKENKKVIIKVTDSSKNETIKEKLNRKLLGFDG